MTLAALDSSSRPSAATIYVVWRTETSSAPRVCKNDGALCTDLAKSSYRCLEESHGDKTACSDFLKKYQSCRKAQHSKKR